MPELFKIDKSRIKELNYSHKTEYLLTNNYGAYSSSTITGCNTRKYHGMLNIPVSGYENLICLISKINISVVIRKNEYCLSTNKFPGVYHPEGYNYIESFSYNRYPEFTYKIKNTILTKSIIMPEDLNAVLIKFQTKSKDIYLKISPFLSYRDIHKLSKENSFLNNNVKSEGNSFFMTPYEDLPEIYFEFSANCNFYFEPVWWNNFEYTEEQERGYPFHEDLFCPGHFKLKLEDDVIFSLSDRKLKSDLNKLWANTTKGLLKHATSETKEVLKNSSSRYLYKDNSQEGIIAGYHWFREWGRDTLISLEGTALCTGEFDKALSILKKYTFFEKNGLLPNIISIEGGHAYNSIDSSLLYFMAVQKYLEYTGNKQEVKEHLLDTMINIIKAYLDNTVPIGEIRNSGLLFAGNPDTQYTWMDANAYGYPVTPRHGAAVEINALWYNALCFLLFDFPESLDNNLKEKIETQADIFKNNFEKIFFSNDLKSLIDVYRDQNDSDSCIRPNQLFAIGLKYTCISKSTAKIVLKTVKKHLVTPFGLRTLSRSDKMYKPLYRGDQNIRDSAYHQGTVWPWLIGIFCDALFKTFSEHDKVREYINKTFKKLWTEHLYENGIFHISEIFEPEEPYNPCGCIAQAWSTAEVLRVMNML